jgi:hypothetical protein
MATRLGWIGANGAWLVVIALLLVLVVARPFEPRVVVQPSSNGYATALEACHAPPTAEKAGATLAFDWHVAVEEDRTAASALVLVSGSQQLMCVAYRNPDGTFGNAFSGLGGITLTSTPTLTYDTGTAPTESASPPVIHLVIGRVPDGTARVEVSAANGDVQRATLGGGRYLAWLETAALPVRIAAYSATSGLLADLTDPNGLQPTP